MWFEHMFGVLDITADCVPRLLSLGDEITVYKDHSTPPESKVYGGLQRGQSQEEGKRILPCSSVADRIAMSSLWFCLEQFRKRGSLIMTVYTSWAGCFICAFSRLPSGTHYSIKTHCQSTAINHAKFTSTRDLSGNQKTVRLVVITHS